MNLEAISIENKDEFQRSQELVFKKQCSAVIDHIEWRNSKNDYPSKRRLKLEDLKFINKVFYDKRENITQRKMEVILSHLFDSKQILEVQLESSKKVKYKGYKINFWGNHGKSRD